MGKLISLIATILLAAAGASAQTESRGTSKSVDVSSAAERKAASSVVRPIAYSAVGGPASKKRGVVRFGPPTTYLKEGLSTEEVVRLLGTPASITEREENGHVVKTYEFSRGAGRTLLAEFVGSALVRSRTETRTQSLLTNNPVQ